MDRNLDAEILPFCDSQGLAVTAYSPLAGGILSGKYRRGEAPPEGSRAEMSPNIYGSMLSDQAFDDLDRVSAMAADRGVSMSSLAVAWLLAQPSNLLPIIGPRRPDHLDLVADAVALKFTDSEVEELNSLFAASRGVPRRWVRPGVSR
jgi:aryl-alcohol dehydrogenase-like predicted oxidoreductase